MWLNSFFLSLKCSTNLCINTCFCSDTSKYIQLLMSRQNILINGKQHFWKKKISGETNPKQLLIADCLNFLYLKETLPIQGNNNGYFYGPNGLDGWRVENIFLNYSFDPSLLPEKFFQ